MIRFLAALSLSLLVSLSWAGTPIPPGALGAIAVGSSRIDLGWTDYSNDETGFVVARSTTAGGPYSDVATVGANVNWYNDCSGLAAGTTYYYVVRAYNGYGNSANSNQASATTAPTDYIIDNPQAAVTGTWSTGTSAADKYGSDYRYKGPGTGTAYLSFAPNLAAQCNYQVSEWHPQGTNRTPAAQHVITYNGGSATVYKNQQTNGGRWNVLGTYNFAGGTSGNVKITDSFSGSYVVMADAIRFTASVPADIIVDNASASFSASSNWATGTSAADKYGTSYRYHSTAAVIDQAVWNFSISTAANYEIFGWWSQGTNRARMAPFIMPDSTTVTKNQQTNGGVWTGLGTRSLTPGAKTVKLSCNTTTGYVVVADAIKVVWR